MHGGVAAAQQHRSKTPVSTALRIDCVASVRHRMRAPWPGQSSSAVCQHSWRHCDLLQASPAMPCSRDAARVQAVPATAAHLQRRSTADQRSQSLRISPIGRVRSSSIREASASVPASSCAGKACCAAQQHGRAPCAPVLGHQPLHRPAGGDWAAVATSSSGAGRWCAAVAAAAAGPAAAAAGLSAGATRVPGL